MRRSLTVVAAASCVVASVLFASAAQANGRFPAANQLVVAPNDPNTFVLRTTFGILVSRDRAATWDWVCEKAVGYGGQTEDPSLGITANTTIIAGTFEGLAVSPDTGCGWSYATGGLAQKIVVDVVIRPGAPESALALTNKFKAVDDAGDPTYSSQVYSTTNNAAAWSALGVALDPKTVLETLEVAPSDPHRIYVSGFTGAGANVKGVLFVSNDDGMTWTPRSIPLDGANEHAPFIAAVDPKNADRVYVRTSGSASSRLLVTNDGGMTFTPVFTGTQLAGFALSADGSKVYIGGPKDGLLVASTADFQFKKTSSVAVQCLRTSGTTLYVCSNEVSGFILGASEDDGATIQAKLHLATIRGPLACPASTPGAACAADWPALRRDTLGIQDEDAGTTDAGTAPAPAPKSCGCRAVPSDGGWLASIAAAIAIIVVGARKRRRVP